MKRVAVGLVIGSLVLGVMSLPAQARGWRHGHHRHYSHFRHHDHHDGHGHFLGGFLAGAATFLVLDALATPRVVYAPPVTYAPVVSPVEPPPVVYGPPVVYQPAYPQVPVCRDVWVAGRWETRSRQENGFTTYYQVLVPGAWQRHCY